MKISWRTDKSSSVRNSASYTGGGRQYRPPERQDPRAVQRDIRALFAIRDDRGTGSLEPGDGVADRRVIERPKRRILGISPRDGVDYRPVTTLDGIVEKHTGTDPFDATEGQLAAIRGKRFGPYVERSLGSVPVNFMADLDITGGNSGSPTLNGDGELVGLAFDGNIESVSASWMFEKPLTRSIHVDVRYMLWVMDILDDADHLIREMGLDASE